MKKLVVALLCTVLIGALTGCSVAPLPELKYSELGEVKEDSAKASEESKAVVKEEISKEIEVAKSSDEQPAATKEAKEEPTPTEEPKEDEKMTEDIKFTESTPEEALAFAANMKAGWNLGNTLDANINGQHNLLNSETCWGNPKTTKDIFVTVKNAGFSTVRIPVSWHNHVKLSSDGQHLNIDEEWLRRVKEVVDYAIDSDLYVIINIHHDNIPEGKLGYIPDYANEEQAMWYISEIWSQVAPYFKDYDEHLIFEAMNEPRLTNDSTHEWWLEKDNQHCKEAVDVINKLNQSFIDIVRSSGGNNPDRYVMIPGYCATMAGLRNDGFVLPEDPASYKLMLAFHAYIPYDFVMNPDLSFDKFDREQAGIDINYNCDSAKKFMKKGIPVVLGEYGAVEKNGNLSERVAYYEFYTKKNAAAGIPSIVWDNGFFEGNGERFGLLDRRANEFRYPDIVNAIVGAYE